MILKQLKNGKNTLNQYAHHDKNLVEISGVQRDALQQTLLEIYDYIDELCKKNGIKFCLIGGSALGAVRHKGFIPWDDDLDLGMTRSDYNKFKNVFVEQSDGRYILNAPNLTKKVRSRFPKVLKKGTIMREITDSKDEETQGIFVDIFIIDNVPDNVVHRYFKGLLCNACEFIAGQVQLVENLDKITKQFYLNTGTLNYLIRTTVGKIFSYRSSHQWLNRIDRIIQCNDENSYYCTLATGRKHYFGETMEREKFFPYSEAEFCGRKVNLPLKWDDYLKNAYGDYMKIPPESEREHHYVKELKIN